MDGKVLQLFKENHVPQVRDTLLQVTQDLAKNDVVLNQNLKLHYIDILSITTKVNDLYSALQDNDIHFRQLCFDDDQYQLSKLPEFNHLNSHVATTTTTTTTYEEEEDKTSEQNIDLLLIVSEWSIAVTGFVASLTTSATTSLSIFDKLLTKFDQLINYNQNHDDDDIFLNPSFKYYHSIQSKLAYLLQNLISNESITGLTPLQWVKLYNLINHTTKAILPWDSNDDETLIIQLNNIIMDKIIILILSRNTPYEKHHTSTNESQIIPHFIKSSEFNTRLLTHIKTKINENITQLKTIINEENDHQSMTIQNDTITNLEDLNLLIEESKFDSMGLINKSRQRIFDLVEPTIQLIQDLIDYHCDMDSIKQIQTELLTLLRDRCEIIDSSQSRNSEKEPTHDNNTSHLINQYVSKYHTNKFTQLIQSQIQRLESLSI